jgi:hypothetical protein
MAPIRLDQVNLVITDAEASRIFSSRFGLDFGNADDPMWDAHQSEPPMPTQTPT